MDSLELARRKIRDIDERIAQLFQERFATVDEIVAHKMAHGMPAFDPLRHAEQLATNAEAIADPQLRAYWIDLVQNLFRISRQYQSAAMEGLTVAYAGVEGAWASIAARKIFPSGKLVGYPDFQDAYEAVVRGDCHCVVLPIENSMAGEVAKVLDMMFEGPLWINGVYDLSIVHHLMAKPGTRLADITHVLSHPQALFQCNAFLHREGLTPCEYRNTAAAAQHVAESSETNLAAIASEDTARLYNLEILSRSINEHTNNATRFAVFSRATGPDNTAGKKHSILMFNVKNEAGALAKAINTISRYHYNMMCLRSRPMKNPVWEHFFYIELDGDLYDETGQAMLAELALCCEHLKHLGTFRYPAILNH